MAAAAAGRAEAGKAALAAAGKAEAGKAALAAAVAGRATFDGSFTLKMGTATSRSAFIVMIFPVFIIIKLYSSPIGQK